SRRRSCASTSPRRCARAYGCTTHGCRRTERESGTAMQHDVLDGFLRAAAGVTLGWVREVRGRLTLWSLNGPRGSGWQRCGEGRWRETGLALRGWRGVRNLWASPVTVEAADTLAGGMADRAVAATRLVAPGAEDTVPVVPLGARWWDEGRVRPAGTMSPF